MPEPGGWSALLDGPDPWRGDGRFPIAAYSELMPGPYVARKPYGWIDPTPIADEHGWRVSAYEEAHQLGPGLARVAAQLAERLRRLAAGERALSLDQLTGNPYWPPLLAERAPSLGHDRGLIIATLALSRTLDDKGRVRWTVFGASEQGPARGFWLGFYRAPGRERPIAEQLALVDAIFAAAFGERLRRRADLRRLGVRVLRHGPDPDFPAWADEPLPGWARALELRA